MTTRNELADIADAKRRPLATAKFWLDLGERVVASAAGGALAAATVVGFAIQEPASWEALAVGAGTAALVSLLKGLIGASVGNGSASLAPSV